jgi:hypothetical protein
MDFKKNNPSKTVLTIVVGFLVVFLITEMKWALLTAIIVGLLGVLSDFISKQIDYLWGLLTKVLSYIVPNIILSLVFFVFLFPIATLSKLFGKKDPLKLKNKEDSVYVTHERSFTPESFEKIF